MKLIEPMTIPPGGVSQHAHLVTMSFPYGPNVLAIFNILAARLQGTAAVLDVLGAGAAAGPASVRPLRLALLDLERSQGLPQVGPPSPQPHLVSRELCG